LRYHTINAAYILGEEDKLGSIEVGKQADLVVLSKDIMECPVDDLLSIKALTTIVGGKIVCQDKSNGSPLVQS